MSKKHFEQYLESVYKSYLNMERVYKAYQEECEKDMTSPDVLKQLEETMRPIRDSYNTLRYVKYLLDMPNKDSKGARYINQNRKLLNSIDDKYKKEAVLKNNEEVLNKAEQQITGGDN